MAERRMFAKTIIDSDAFLDMPMSARLLYYDLSMRADDDGFVNSPKKIMRMIGATQDDLSILAIRKFIIPFENGIVVIKHWYIHNYIRKDTYNETQYKEQKELLEFDENKSYRLKNNAPLLPRYEPVDEPSTQVSIGKDSIGKDIYNVCFEEFWKHYPRKKEKANAYKKYLARCKAGRSEEELLEACLNYEAECKALKREERYIKLGATFLSESEPFVDYLNQNYTPPKTSSAGSKPKEAGEKINASIITHGGYDFSALENEMFTGE